jgi:hypothetical protein
MGTPHRSGTCSPQHPTQRRATDGQFPSKLPRQSSCLPQCALLCRRHCCGAHNWSHGCVLSFRPRLDPPETTSFWHSPRLHRRGPQSRTNCPCLFNDYRGLRGYTALHRSSMSFGRYLLICLPISDTDLPPLGSITSPLLAASKPLAAAAAEYRPSVQSTSSLAWPLPQSAPHLHIFGTCYKRHNVTRHIGARCVSRWRDAGAGHRDVRKEQNAYPIRCSGHSTASVPWPS